jgi:hypothetical protein
MVGIANTKENITLETDKMKEQVDTLLNNETLIETVQNLVSKVVATTIISNTTQISNIITASNTFRLTGGEGGCIMEGGYTRKNVNQEITVKTDIINQTRKDIINEIVSVVNNNIVANMEAMVENSDTSSNINKVGSTLGGIVGGGVGVFTNVADEAGDMLSAILECTGIANTCKSNDVTSTEKDLIKKYNLDNSFAIKDSIDTSNDISGNITKDELTNIINSIIGSNVLEFDVCPEEINIINFKQKLSIVNITANESITTFSNKVATNFINTVEKVLKSMVENVKDESITDINSDIGNMGIAAAAVIKSGGEAVGKVVESSGEAVAKTVDSVGEGSGNLISSLGKTIGKSLGSLAMPLLIIGIIGIIGVIFYMVVLPQLKKFGKTQM